jgi:hypothetical protein
MPFPFHKILFVVFSFESREFGYCRLSLPRPGRLGHGRQAPPSGHSDILDPLSSVGGCSLAELYSSTDSSRSKTIDCAASYGDSKSLPRNLNVDARQTIPSPLLSALDSSFSHETCKTLGQRVRWLWQRARPPPDHQSVAAASFRCGGNFCRPVRNSALPVVSCSCIDWPSSLLFFRV